MALITDLPSSSTVANNDVFVKDTGSTTQKITFANLKNAVNPDADLLYDGGKATAGTIAISSAYSNYKYLLFVYNTNVDGGAELVPSSYFANTTQYLMLHLCAGDWVTASNRFQFNSTCQIRRTDNTHFAVSSKYNDSNWILGVEKIYGMK